ncbi:5799_t:CDS:2 [Acaulospora morrowiae]|uniref:5799_t:CDS:1 n=1 Tax=Acaulospora morrowiae TaxID=94023 RepID=A0A9N9FQF8_9GLOM|nr:5799_t:CDS:2 [Acaulospora morrowiae]
MKDRSVEINNCDEFLTNQPSLQLMLILKVAFDCIRTAFRHFRLYLLSPSEKSFERSFLEKNPWKIPLPSEERKPTLKLIREMPKVKSDKKPTNINTNVNPIITNYPPLQPAPVIHALPPPKFNDSHLFNGALVFQDQRLTEEEHALLRNPPYQLTLCLEVLLSPARRNRKNKTKPENKIPRPQNAWVLFRKDYEASQRMQFPEKALKMKTVSTDAGDVWRNQSSQVKRYFEILSRLAHEYHKAMYPNYKYTPKKKQKDIISNKDWIFHNGVKTLVANGVTQVMQVATPEESSALDNSFVSTSPHYYSSPTSPQSTLAFSISPDCSPISPSEESKSSLCVGEFLFSPNESQSISDVKGSYAGSSTNIGEYDTDYDIFQNFILSTTVLGNNPPIAGSGIGTDIKKNENFRNIDDVSFADTLLYDPISSEFATRNNEFFYETNNLEHTDSYNMNSCNEISTVVSTVESKMIVNYSEALPPSSVIPDYMMHEYNNGCFSDISADTFFNQHSSSLEF